MGADKTQLSHKCINQQYNKNVKKTRILYIGPIPPEVGGSSYGGIATHLWDLANQACKHGYDVYILANTAHSFTRNGIKIVSVPPENMTQKAFKAIKMLEDIGKSRVAFLNFLSVRERLYVLYRAYYLRKVLEGVKPDIIHIHSLHNYDILALKILDPPTPIIVTDHGAFMGVKTEKDLNKVRTALTTADSVIFVSNYCKEKLKELGAGIPKKSFVIHNPINPPPAIKGEKAHVKQGRSVIFFSAVTEPIKRKGLNILLKAFAIDSYLRGNCKLIIRTSQEVAKHVRSFMLDHDIDGLVLDPLTRNELFEYYTISDAFVMPSRMESFGIVYVEALSVGTPVVGHHRILEEIENVLGIYIGEKFDATHEGALELAEKIKKVLSMKFDRDFLSRRVIEKYSWDVKFSEYDSIYKSYSKW